MSLRKLANQFLSKVKSTGVNRVLITSVHKGDGKARFMSELAAEMSRVNQELVPLAAANLHIVNPARFKDKLVVVYGPAYYETEGLHTIPERWMRAFDAVVVVVMARRTRSRELVKLINWLKDYNYQHIWPVLNEKLSPDISESWMRLKGKIGIEKNEPRRLSRGSAASVWQPLFPLDQQIDEYPALPAHEVQNVITNSAADENETSGFPVEQQGQRQAKSISSHPPPTASILAGDIDHTSTLQGPRRVDNLRIEGPVFVQPSYVQSARTTLRSSVPPSKGISDVPPPAPLDATPASKRDMQTENTDTSQTSRQFSRSATATMISASPPASTKQLKSEPPQESATPVENPDFTQTVLQYAPSVKTTMVSSVPPSSIKRVISDPPPQTASAKDKKER